MTHTEIIELIEKWMNDNDSVTTDELNALILLHILLMLLRMLLMLITA